MNAVTIGACGWSYKDWVGNFYPAGTSSGDFLAYYAERFSIVEVDSTFYRPPSPKTVQSWAAKTPAGFRFSLKVPQIITHEKLLRDCKEETEAFTAAVRLLGPKLLCCCLQFGYFNRDAFDSQAAFLDRLEPYLAAWPADVPLALETRNKWWLNQTLIDVLRSHNVVLVLTDQEWMPPPLEVVEKLDVVTGPVGYFRLLGDRRAVDDLTSTLDHIVVDRSDQLRQTAKAIARLAGRVPVVTFVNNHYAGHAPTTIQQLRAELDDLTATPW
jgi:uncharacterized protein YecE (DUF72 family)